MSAGPILAVIPSDNSSHSTALFKIFSNLLQNFVKFLNILPFFALYLNILCMSLLYRIVPGQRKEHFMKSPNP